MVNLLAQFFLQENFKTLKSDPGILSKYTTIIVNSCIDQPSISKSWKTTFGVRKSMPPSGNAMEPRISEAQQITAEAACMCGTI